MTNEELAVLIQSGEREKLLELWEQVRRFIWRQAKRWAAYRNSGMELEDFTQTGFLALIDAVYSYNTLGGGNFLTWYNLRLKSAFTEAAGLRTLRTAQDPLRHATSLDAPLTDDPGDPLTLADAVPDPDAEAEMEDVDERDRQVRLHAAMETVLAQLPEDQMEAIKGKYYRGQHVDSKAHAAALRALRQPSVSRALKVYI